MHHPPANNPEDEQPRLFELTDEQREYVQEVASLRPRVRRLETVKISLKQLGLLHDLRYATSFIEAGGKLLPTDSLPARLLLSAAELCGGVGRLADFAIERQHKRLRSCMVHSRLLTGIRQHGTLLYTFNEAFSNAVDVIQLGEHVIWIEHSQTVLLGTRTVRTLSDPAEIARDVIRLSMAELGDTTRASLTQDGLAVDGEAAPPQASAQVLGLVEQLRRELPHGPRSVLLYGPTGSGKTAASRQIVERLASTTLVATSDMLVGSTQCRLAFDLLGQWAPESVVIDDIDRATSTAEGDAELLAGLSRLRGTCRLIVATANTTRVMSGALLRPGRFDHVLRVDSIDESVARSMLPHVPEATVKAAVEAKLLAAYLAELDLRCRSGTDAAESLAELVERQRAAGDGMAAVGPQRSSAHITW
jgi:hypothetical protein